LKKDYTETEEAAQAGKSSRLVEGGILPMLAHKYTDHKAKVVYPCAAQRKLDGHRCIAIVDAAGKCTLWSRTRKPINSVPHIVAAIEAQIKPGTILDGELFASDFNARFEELTHLIRQTKPELGHEAVEYWVYDYVNDEPFEIRTKRIGKLKLPLVVVETVTVMSEEAMQELFSQYVGEGFEGLMLRSLKGLYVNKRSTDLLKVKERDDAEFEFVSVEEGRGKLTGHGIFVLKTTTGTEFRAKMKGDTAKLKDYWEHPAKYIGKQVTVAYQGLTSDGVPRFPVAVRVLS
jgi:DNA ligase-1